MRSAVLIVALLLAVSPSARAGPGPSLTLEPDATDFALGMGVVLVQLAHVSAVYLLATGGPATALGRAAIVALAAVDIALGGIAIGFGVSRARPLGVVLGSSWIVGGAVLGGIVLTRDVPAKGAGGGGYGLRLAWTF